MHQLLQYIVLVAGLYLAPVEELPAIAPGMVFREAYRTDSSTVIPFTRAGNLIMVKARVDTTEGNFIIDTGAPHLVLNITYFRDYPATLVQDAEQTSITGASPGLLRTRVRDFAFGTLTLSQLDADLAALGHIENSKGVKILGLLGLDLFRQCELIIDYEQNLIYLYRIPRKENDYRHVMLDDTSRYDILSFDLKDSRMMVSTVVKGKKLKFVVDCAAETNVLDSRLPNKILESVTITRRVVLTGSNNRKVDALYGSLQELAAGNISFSNLPVLVTNLENTCFSYAGCVDGVLGFDFLSRQKVGFNFVKRKMYIWR